MNRQRKPIVFVTQIPHKKDVVTGSFLPSINISTANEHGEILVMMPPRTSFHSSDILSKQIREHLENYSFENGDSIIAMGDPMVTAVTLAIMGQMYRRFTILKWDKNLGRYITSRIVI